MLLTISSKLFKWNAIYLIKSIFLESEFYNLLYLYKDS